MYDGSKISKSFRSQNYRRVRVSTSGLPRFLMEEEQDRTPRRVGIAVAVVLVIGMLVVQIPESEPLEVEEPRVAATYVMKQVRFEPPPPRAEQKVPQKRQKKKVIPVPDLTPEDPEPIRTEEDLVIDVDLPVGDEVFGVPDAPPGTGDTIAGAMSVGGDVQPPVKIHYPSPGYTEEARQARIQGVVILRATIDSIGHVHDVKVLKGLPMGLSEKAIEAVHEWRFKPATLNGEPVPVYFNFTISFYLQ